MGWTGQVLKYYVVAATTSGLYVGVLALALAGPWHYMFAILLAHAVVIAIAFPIQRKWVFGSQGRLRTDFRRFVSVWGLGAIVGFVATPLLVELQILPPLAAQIASIVAVSLASFVAHRIFTFSSPGSAGQRIQESRNTDRGRPT